MNDLHDMRPTVLVVDDTPNLIDSLRGILKETYRVKATIDSERALAIAQEHPQPDIILLDVMMPGMNGYEVCRRLKADPATADIPVLFLTAMAEATDEHTGFEAGAVDYLAKPVSPPILLARLKTHLLLKSARDFLRDKNDYLQQEVERRTREVQAIQDVSIVAMASLAETRDPETGNHIRRTQNYVRLLALHLREHPRFCVTLGADGYIEMLFKSAPLHDIGKVGIPDHILLKPGRLTPEEFEIMKTHTTLGHNAILAGEQGLASPGAFLQLAREIIHSHHEKWDGSGYPEGLRGEAIPLSARLMALADVYDALISWRVYKEPMSHEAAMEIIRRGRGTHFDPDIAEAFLALGEYVKAIAQRYADPGPAQEPVGNGSALPAS